MYMKPGYLLPVLDLESGNDMSTAALTQWCLDYINTIHNATGVYPMVYTNSSYNNDEVTAALAFTNISSSPHTGPLTYQWLARPGMPALQPVSHSRRFLLTPYPMACGILITRLGRLGSDPSVKPWVFWQNGSGALNGFTVDYNAAEWQHRIRDLFFGACAVDELRQRRVAKHSELEQQQSGRRHRGDRGRHRALPGPQDWVKLQNTGGGTVNLTVR